MNTWLIIYFSINLFLSGCYFSLVWVRGSTFWQKARAVLTAFFIVFFGLLGILVLFVSWVFIGLFEWIDSTFRIGFIFAFYFSKKYKRLEDFQLEGLKKSYDSLKHVRSLRGALARGYIRMILKRHKLL